MSCGLMNKATLLLISAVESTALPFSQIASF